MATNALRVFELAMNLIDEVNESSGAFDTSDTKEYKNRTLAILNILRGELFPFSDTYAPVLDEDGKPNYKRRPIVLTIENFEDDIQLDDYICQTVMPYGLAAHLLLDENPSTAGYFQQRYDELKAQLSRGMPAVAEDIDDVYGRAIPWEYNNMGRW